jgi:hypothetical protein
MSKKKLIVQSTLLKSLVTGDMAREPGSGRFRSGIKWV